MQHSKMDSKTAPDEKKIELEEQFILRLPLSEARYIREVLATKPKKLGKVMKIELNEELHNGVVYLRKKQLPGILYTLPTIIDSTKTVNRINIYKTASISQMLVCKEKAAAAAKTNNKENRTPDHQDCDDRKHLYPHGLTAPMKNVRKHRFRKTMRNLDEVEEAADIQKEIMLLLRTDNEAVTTRYEIGCMKSAIGGAKSKLKRTRKKNITEQLLFGNISSDSESSITSTYDIIEFNN